MRFATPALTRGAAKPAPATNRMNGLNVAAAVRLVKNPGTEDSNVGARSGKPDGATRCTWAASAGAKKSRRFRSDQVTGSEHVIDRQLLLAGRGRHSQLDLVTLALRGHHLVPVEDRHLADHPVLEPPGSERAEHPLDQPPPDLNGQVPERGRTKAERVDPPGVTEGRVRLREQAGQTLAGWPRRDSPARLSAHQDLGPGSGFVQRGGALQRRLARADHRDLATAEH